MLTMILPPRYSSDKTHNALNLVMHCHISVEKNVNSHMIMQWEIWLFIIIFAKCERSEHWRRLRDWSFCPCSVLVHSFLLCKWWLIMAMTSLHQQRKQQCRLLHFPPSPAVKWLFLFPSLSLLYRVVVDVVAFVGLVVIVMSKSLHLVEICTLRSAF